MELNKAKEIVSALAEGIDPITGELLSEDSVYNKGDVVRALYAVLDACGGKKVRKKLVPKEPENYDQDLYEILRMLRNRIASENGMVPFQVFGNSALKYMAAQKPTTKEEFLEIRGVGEYTAKRYGKAFLNEIKNYLSK